MRIMRKLVLLSVMALAAMALAASSASAQGVEVVEEGTGVHCAPCEIHAVSVGTDHLSVPALGGVIVMRCTTELSGEIYEDGTGHLTANLQDPTGQGGGCTRVPCNGVGESSSEVEWDILSTTETATNAGTMVVRFCLDARNNPNVAGTHCDLTLAVSEPTSHRYRLTTAQLCPSGIRYEGTYDVEGTPIEVEHDA